MPQQAAVGGTDVEDIVIWGNHSPDEFPRLFIAKVKR